MIKVDLASFKDFLDLMQNGNPDFSMVEKLRAKLDEINHRVELKQAIYGDNANLGHNPVITNNEVGAVFARKMWLRSLPCILTVPIMHNGRWMNLRYRDIRLPTVSFSWFRITS